ncbi:MAG: VOC family protein, partial [Rhizobiales bacterium]|nr:VOC family protein [Hyphomicrobiales bacterium]
NSPARLARFYTGALGMTEQVRDDGHHLSYGGKDASLILRQAGADDSYQANPLDRYWKIGITVPNVDIAHHQLYRGGIEVSTPRQFQDIGYMCHLRDPEGFSIELLQHHFDTNRPVTAGEPDAPLGGGTRIGQVTLRTSDIAADLAFYRDQLGMKLLSIQPVETHGFALYFLAMTDEEPPISDLYALRNHEWLWQRPYTTLEFQHLNQSDDQVVLDGAVEPGFEGIVVSGTNLPGPHLADGSGGMVYLTN